MAYATVEQVEAGFRSLDSDEQAICAALLEEAAVLIDAVAAGVSADAKRVVSCRIVRRGIGDGSASGIPMGASQGSQSALGYSQSWTMGTGGGAGELYLGKTDRQILGIGNQIGVHSPTEDLVPEGCFEAMP